MISKERLLRGLSDCFRMEAPTPILLRHRREALRFCGLPRERVRRAARILDALVEDSARHAGSLEVLRELILRGERDVY